MPQTRRRRRTYYRQNEPNARATRIGGANAWSRLRRASRASLRTSSGGPSEAEESEKRVEAERTEDVRNTERRCAIVQVEKEVLAERLKMAEGALESGRKLGAEVNVAHKQLAQVRGELQNAQRQMRELEDEVMRTDERGRAQTSGKTRPRRRCGAEAQGGAGEGAPG